MAKERPEHGFIVVSQAEADTVGRVEFQTTLRLTIDMQGKAVGGGGVGKAAAVLFQSGVELDSAWGVLCAGCFFGFNFVETPFLGGNGVFILLKPLLSDGLIWSADVWESLSVDVKPF